MRRLAIRGQTLIAGGLFGVTMLLPTATRPQPPAAVPSEWAAAPGWTVFVAKGCAACHRVRGVGDGTVGPDLAALPASRGLFELGAAMWNHQSKMGDAMREARIQRPQLTALELSSLASFLFTTQYDDASGDPGKGSRLFTAKGCVQCHTVGGRGGSVGPALDAFKRLKSPILMAAAMWNHGPLMAQKMEGGKIDWPTFRGTELADLAAYIVSAAQGQGGESVRVVPGIPDRGAKLFADKGCATCHPVGPTTEGPTAPRLSAQAHRVNPTEFAGLMWNHSARMWATMRKRSLAPPQLTGPEMADIAAYLYMTYYFDSPTGRAPRGRELVEQKGCLSCHAIYRKGGKTASDLAINNVVGTVSGQVAAMWNHGRYMETEGRRQAVTLPALTSHELADISAYLAGLSAGVPKPK
jgi:mono/diheme cytochrome c family protein